MAKNKDKNKKVQKKIKSLYSQDKNIYSISKINLYHNCQYAYYLSYINKEDRVQNIYSYAGGYIHDILEKIYDNDLKYDITNIKKDFEDMILECELLGYKFPTEQIRKNWISDMTHFVSNYKKLDMDVLMTEEQILMNIDNIWFQGFIDIIKQNENSIDILDWKTSSKFSGKDKLRDAGRQLLLYKLAKEKQGFKVDRVGWFMTKYLNVTYTLKNGKQVTRMLNRGKWVSDFQKALTSIMDQADYKYALENLSCSSEHIDKVKDILLEFMKEKKVDKLLEKGDWGKIITKIKKEKLYDIELNNILEECGYCPVAIELDIDECILNKSIDTLPNRVKDLIKIEDCIIWYDHTEQDVQEAINYVKKSVQEIESKDTNNVFDWDFVGLDDNNFFCNYLCGQRTKCDYNLNNDSEEDNGLPF